jgi:uncharacterized membrane protein YphA (DoxX/SURF4 family)
MTPSLPPWSAPVLFGLAALILFLITLFVRVSGPAGSGINRGTRFFLVLLRLAIGWHFLVEGLEKVNNPSWSSAPYFHAATGPLGKYFRSVADERFLEKLKLNDTCANELAVTGASQLAMTGVLPSQGPLTAASSLYPGKLACIPPALDRDWERYLETFEREFELDETQKHIARIKLNQAKAKTLLWMTTPQQVDKPSPYLNRPAKMTVAERVEYYQDLLEKMDEVANDHVANYGAGAKKRLADTWDEAQKVYADLQRDLKTQTDEMKKDLRSALPAALLQAKVKLPEVRPAFDWSPLAIGDAVVPWALCIIGVCLLLGLLSRTNCLLGALFMLTVFLPMIPLPGWSGNPRAEGHYLFIDKNIIELLALLALATTRSGRWAGLDGLFMILRPERRQVVAPSPEPAVPSNDHPHPQPESVVSGSKDPYEIRLT